MSPVTSTIRLRGTAAAWLTCVGLGLVGLTACRPGVPVIDTGPKPAQMDGTLQL